MLARDQFKIILSLCEMLFPLLLYSFYYCMMSGGWKRYSVFFLIISFPTKTIAVVVF